MVGVATVVEFLVEAVEFALVVFDFTSVTFCIDVELTAVVTE